MIVNIRGTSGSGKSTLIRQVMERYGGTRIRVKEPNRKQPLAYWLVRDGVPQLAVLGHYETPCGGCDTINGLDAIYELVRKYHDQHFNVLYEGLIVCSDVRRAVELHKDGLPFTVIFLGTPLEKCIESVNERRRAKKADAEPVNPGNTIAKHKMCGSTLPKFTAAGVDTRLLDREAALVTVLDLLEIP